MKEKLEQFRRFEKRAKWSMLLPACALAFLWFLQGNAELSGEEALLWRKVRAAQEHLASWRDSFGIDGLYPEYDFGVLDPWRTGFIGVEWSPVTTTLGPLQAKRASADPLWSVFALREFRSLGLREGETIVLLSSSSFPGLVFSVLAAAEHTGLHVVWVHSLGSSTWGANIPELLWPEIGRILRNGGFLSRKPDAYTLGGRNETGRDLSPEGREMLVRSAEKDGVPIIETESLAGMISLKSELIRGSKPRLVVNIGGAHSTFGSVEIVPPGGGLYTPEDIGRLEAGEGVFRKALDSGFPVLHFLNLRELAKSAGIPFDAQPSPRFAAGPGIAASAAGVVLYVSFLSLFRRWRREE